MNGLGTTSLELNTTAGPLRNWHNRSAIDYAINRKALINLIFFGHTRPAYSQYPPSSWAYNPNLKIPYSLADARKQLKLAGDPKGFSLTLQVVDSSTDEQMGEAIASELGKIGIQVKIEPLDFTTLLENAVNGNYQFNILGWSGRPDPDQNSYAFDTTGGSFNYPKYSNADVNRFLLQARESTNQSVRARLYNDAAKIVLQQAPYVFIAYTPVIQAWSTKVHGFREYPDDLMRLTSVWLQ
jgi:peptide/nickel transport system substrate-binding protein